MAGGHDTTAIVQGGLVVSSGVLPAVTDMFRHVPMGTGAVIGLAELPSCYWLLATGYWLLATGY